MTLRALVWSAAIGGVSGTATGVLLVLLNDGDGGMSDLLVLAAWCMAVGAVVGIVLGAPAGPVVAAALRWPPARFAGAVAVLTGVVAVAVWATLVLLAFGWGRFAGAYGAFAAVLAAGPIAVTVRAERRRAPAVSR